MQPITILIVEDNDSDAYHLQSLLDRMGVTYSLHNVTDGENAVDFLLKRAEYADAPDPDLIFLDLRLPKLSGIEVLESLPQSRQLPLCILTGSPQERDQLKKRFGIRRIAYIVKPVNREMMLNCFRCYEHLHPLAEEITVANAS